MSLDDCVATAQDAKAWVAGRPKAAPWHFLSDLARSTMNVVCVGVDHRTTPLAVRERLAFSAREAKALLTEFAAGRLGDALDVDELAILSTCNRVELYAAVRDENSRTEHTIAVLTRLLSRAGMIWKVSIIDSLKIRNDPLSSSDRNPPLADSARHSAAALGRPALRSA